MYIFELMQNAYTHIEDTCNYLALWIHLENLHSYFAFAKPLSHYIYRSYRILIGLFLIIEGITDFFQLRYYRKKFLHATPSAFLNGNSSKLCMLAYYHVNIFISWQQIDRTIFFKGLLPFFTLNILSEKLYMKLFLHFNWEFLKTYNMQIHISVWQFNWAISEGVIVLFENPPTF